jgi:hypothetical protein
MRKTSSFLVGRLPPGHRASLDQHTLGYGDVALRLSHRSGNASRGTDQRAIVFVGVD